MQGRNQAVMQGRNRGGVMQWCYQVVRRDFTMQAGSCSGVSKWSCRDVSMERGTMQKCFQVVMQGRQHGRGDDAETLPGGHAGASTRKG